MYDWKRCLQVNLPRSFEDMQVCDAAALCAHAGNMQSPLASLSIIINNWALDFTFSYQKLVKKKTNHTHTQIQSRTQ